MRVARCGCSWADALHNKRDTQDMATHKSHTLSKALASKIAQQKTLAPEFLPKTRWCARVVLAIASGTDVEESVAVLKAGMGSNWSPIAAFQFMSGKQALFSAECGDGSEKASLLLAQGIAEAVFNEVGNAKLSYPDLQALAAKHAQLLSISAKAI